MPRNPVVAIAATLAMLIAGAACGTRRTHEAVVSAARGDLSPAAARPADSPGGPVDAAASNLDAGSVTNSTARGATSDGAGVSSGHPATVAPAPGGQVGTVPAGGTAPRSSGGPTAAPAGRTPGSPTGGATAPTTPTAKGPKSEIVIGSVATITGPIGAFVKDQISAISVWAKWVNGRGGVSGHPVRHVVADDGGDPARYNALVQQMVEQQKVIAFVFNAIGHAGGDLSYIKKARVPIIGHESGTETAYQEPLVFTPFASGITYADALQGALADVAIPAGKRKLAVLACADFKLCDTFDKSWSGDSARAFGFEVVYRSRPSLTQPDYTAECLSARQAGAQAFIVGIDTASILRLARSCARQSYKPLIGMADQLALPSLLDDPVTDGTVVGTKLAAWPAADRPGLAELHQAFAAMAPGVEVNGAHIGGWVSAKTFEAGAQRLPDNPTSADVLDGLWSIRGNDLGGLTFPLSFEKDRPSPRRTCWSVVLIQQKRFVAPNGGVLGCR